MGALSDATIHDMLGYRFGGRAVTAIANYYVDLSTSLLAADGSGAVLPPTAAGYAPVVAPNDTTTWAAPTARGVSNAVDLLLPRATSDWGIVRAYTIRVNSSAGALVAWGELPAREVLAGMRMQLPAGTLTVTSALPS